MRYLGIFLLLIACLTSNSVQAAEMPTAADFAQLSAEQQTAWRKLLHYKKGIFGDKGLIVAPDFYVSKNGRYSAADEFSAEVADFKNGGRKCDFPARFNWLKKQRLAQGDLQECAEYQKFINDVRPDGITVLFTSAYMSNPASLFGHSLIRIDTARRGTQMLAHGVNFGADAGMERGPVFAFKGLFGLYLGKYNTSPYWSVINTYNNIENRDIWEYHLNLTDEEKIMFIDHLYEMRLAEVRYFFLSKNCSYMLLELIEAIRPQLDLTSGYNYWAIPLDTLKTIQQVPNLVDKVNYRPARYTKIKAGLQAMDAEQYAAFLASVKGEKLVLPEDLTPKQAELLETLYQYYQYEYTAQNMELKEYRRKSFAVLQKRSKMPTIAEPQISGENPVYSHESMHIAIGGGAEKHHSFAQIEIKPAYTSVIDDYWGMIKGAGVQVFTSEWRYYEQKHRLLMQRFTALNVLSLAPADRVFNPWSYESNFDIHREYNPQKDTYGYVGDIHFGVGKTYELSKYLWVYGLAKAQMQYGGFIERNYWLGAVPQIGIFSGTDIMRLHLFGQHSFATSTFGERSVLQTEAAFGITRNLSLQLTYRYSNNKHGHDEESIISMLKYSF